MKDVVRTSQHFYIIFEYCKGGDLAGYLKERQRLPEKQVRRFMKQIANGLKPLNKLRIVHRDLKLSNFLLTDNSDTPTIKICDFGLARQKGSKDTSMMFNTLCGTPMYMAPEVLNGNKYDERADLWSMGTILYELLVGRPPFQGKSLSDLIEKISQGRYIIPTSVSISKVCINLISGLLISDPSKRFTWDDFFNHPFITDSDEDSDEDKKEESEFGDMDSQNISILKKASQEKALKAIRDNQCVTTEDGDDYEFHQRERISELMNEDKPRRKQEYNIETEEDKDSNSDDNSEKLVLKSSSTEYNFYNSDESRGPSIVSSNSSNMQTFKKPFKDAKKLNSSLGIVKEVSNNVIEEDPDEDIKTSKDNSSHGKQGPWDSPKQDDAAQSEKEHVELSNFSRRSDINKIVEFMRDLVHRCNMVLSFYNDKRSHELVAYECEMAYLINKICYEAKVFITTFANSKEFKNESDLQIVSETNEKIDITEDHINLLKHNEEYKALKAPIVKYFLALSDQLNKMLDCINKMDKSFQQRLANNLMKFAIDVVEEAVVLDEDNRAEQAIKKYTQAQFLLDELLSEYYRAQQFDMKDDIKVGKSVSGSQNDTSEAVRNSRSFRCKNSISMISQNEYSFDFRDIKEEEIDKIYTTITNRINRVQN